MESVIDTFLDFVDKLYATKSRYIKLVFLYGYQTITRLGTARVTSFLDLVVTGKK